jgi:hypothetical protein
MRPTTPLKKNDNPYPDTFRAIELPAPFEFPAAMPSLRNNLAALASLKD